MTRSGRRGRAGVWRVAWRLAAYRPWAFAASIVVWTLVWTIPVLTGLVVRALFDRLTAGAPAGLDPVTVLAMLAGVEAVRLVSFYGAMRVWVSLWLKLLILQRANLLSWLVQGPGADRLPGSTGEAVARFRDDVEELAEFLDACIDVTGSAVFAGVAIAIMARIDPVMTFVVILPLGTIAGVTRLATERLRAYRRESRKASASVTGFIGELFSGTLAVKAASAERGAVTRFRELGDARKRAILKDRVWSELVYGFSASSVNVGIGLTLILAARAMRAGTFTVGDFSLFTSYLWSLAGLPRMLGRLFARVRQVGVSVERLTRLLKGAGPDALVEHNPVHVSGPPPPLPAPAARAGEPLGRLDVDGLTYTFPDGGRGLAGIGFSVHAGEFVVVTGRVGSGKTTLVRVLLGLLPAEFGHVLWNGERVDDPGSFLVPPRAAYIAQVPRLFSESMRDNVLLGLGEDGLARAVHLAVLEHDLVHMADGLDTVVGPRGVRLSGGQIQRTAAARMFAREAELYVCDDLSSALDVHTESMLWERVLADTSSATCLVVSHRRSVLRRADRIVLLAGGRLEGTGTLDELLGSSAVMRELWQAAGDRQPVRP